MPPASEIHVTTGQSGKYSSGVVYLGESRCSVKQGYISDVSGGGVNNTCPTSPDTDGRNAQGRLTFDTAGNLYGVTGEGGQTGYGTVYELKPMAGGKWKETIIHNFSNDANGSIPEGGVVVDSRGNLYGATDYGGTVCGCGVVYRLSHDGHGGWAYTVLHTFAGPMAQDRPAV